MTREDIVRMAAISEIALYGLGLEREKFIHHLEKFAALVASAEREACAKLCDSFQARDVGMQPAECAGAIRARGEA